MLRVHDPTQPQSHSLSTLCAHVHTACICHVHIVGDQLIDGGVHAARGVTMTARTRAHTGGDLHTKITRSLVPYTEKEAVGIMRAVLNVLLHCHDVGVAYRCA